MNINPHLSFAGNCQEAFRFYEKTLGGKIEMMMKYSEAPPSGQPDGCGPSMGDKIMHAAMTVGPVTLMGADSPPDRYKQPEGVALGLNPKTADEGRRIFDSLAEGGTVTMPMHETFWSPGFGMTIDRFGILWMVSTEPAS